MKVTTILMLLVLLPTKAHAQVASSENYDALQGVWQGVGRDTAYTLIFCGDYLVGITGADNAVPRMISPVRIKPDTREIVVSRDEKLQHGSYSVTDDQLELTLSRIVPSPEVRSGSKITRYAGPVTYRFKRKQ